MSLIIIDVKSSECVLLPTNSNDLMLNTTDIEKKSMFTLKTMMNGLTKLVGRKRHYEYPLCGYWKIRWSIDVGFTSVNFQNIMNDLCNEWSKHRKIIKHFKVYIGVPVSFMTKQRVMIQCLSKQIQFVGKQITFIRKQEKVTHDETQREQLHIFLDRVESKQLEMESLKDIYIRYNAMMMTTFT